MCELEGKLLLFPGAPARMEIHLGITVMCIVWQEPVSFNLFVSDKKETQVCSIIIIVV